MSAPAISRMADQVNLGRYRGSGLNYVRRVRKVEKAQARNRVLSLFSPKACPGNLSILTMPSIGWEFEWQLIVNREHGKGRLHPRRTFIVSCENSAPIYAAALTQMPGLHKGVVTALDVPCFARAAVRSRSIVRYWLADVDDVLAEPDQRGEDAGVVHYCGPLTEGHLLALGAFGRKEKPRVIVVTSMKARWPEPVAERVRHTSLTEVLNAALPAWDCISELEYADGAPMHQAAFVRAS